ncbi:MAG: hypothetical protein JWP87_5182 [Labilithrix sp.]|nr:hypothetical protein [Labilithrix sp.]
MSLALVALLACSRPGASTSDAGGDAAPSYEPAASVSASASAPAAPAAPDTSSSPARAARRRELSGAPGSGLEARRSSVTRIEAEPVLSANAAALRRQYGGVLPASLAVQATDLGADRRRAILAGAERQDGTLENPMLFIVDEHGAALWSKERPAAGIKPPVGALAIAAGPHGRFALAACDPPTSSVALRLWDEDGSPFADFQALETKACDAVSLLYWPSHGWLIAITAGSETRVQLVTETGALAWSPGRVLGARFRTIAPVTLASDSPSTFVLVQYSQSPGVDRDADHAIAFRYDANAQPMWASPVDLGAVRRVAPGQERIALTRTSDGVLRAALAGGLTVEIRSNGETRRVP